MNGFFNRLMQSGVLLLIFGGLVIQANAGGFLLFEQDVKALGNAFAGGAAMAEDATTNFFNPAGLTRLSGIQSSLGAHYIMPQAEFSNENSTLSPVLTGGVPVALEGGGGGNAGESALVPNFYHAHEIAPDLHAGLGITTPFGLATKYDRGWVGRYHAVDSEVRTLDINPNIAYRVNPWLSAGVGISAQYIDAELSNAVDFGAIGAANGLPTTPQSLDGFAKVTADDWGWRWNAGILAALSDTLRIGLAYRSDIEYTLEGDADIDAPDAAAPIAAAAGLVDTDAKADITLPGHASLSAYYRFHPKLAIMGDLFWTHWSELDELRIELDSGAPDTVTTLNWRDTWRLALGLTYYHNDAWTFRIGAAYDQTPIPGAKRRTPRIADDDRIWTTVGLSWQAQKWLSLDLAYAHLFVDDPKVRKDGLEAEDLFRGALQGSYDASVDIASIQLAAAF